jgi:Fur family ferric uptake transcriptional regulator
VNESVTWSQRTLAALRAAGGRTGSAQRAIVDLLGRQDCCLTAQELYDELRSSGRKIGLASAYRVLDTLTEQGFVQRIDLGAGIARFEAAHPAGDHHHHLVCDDCGKVEAFSDDRLEQALRRVETRVGFAVAAHEVVLHGACADCHAA